MRLGRSAEQRVWLGAGKYCDGCRDAGTNPNCFADSCVKRYSLRTGDPNTYAHSYGDSYCHADGYSDSHTNCDADSYAKGNAKASSDSASAP